MIMIGERPSLDLVRECSPTRLGGWRQGRLRLTLVMAYPPNGVNASPVATPAGTSYRSDPNASTHQLRKEGRSGVCRVCEESDGGVDELLAAVELHPVHAVVHAGFGQLLSTLYRFAADDIVTGPWPVQGEGGGRMGCCDQGIGRCTGGWARVMGWG